MPLSSLPTPNFGAAIQQPNPALQILQAIGQFPQQQRENQMQKGAVDQQKQQMELTKQAMQSNAQTIKQQQQAYEQNERQNAQQRYQFIGSVLQKTPQAASNPATIAQLKQADAVLGTHSFNPDDTINLDAFKTPFGQVPPDQQAAFWAMPAAQRATAGQQYSGLPPDWQTRKQELDPKVAAQIGELQSLANLHTTQGTEAVIRGVNDTRRTDATVTRDAAENKYGASNAAARQAEASAAILRANASARTAAATIAHLNAMTSETYAKINGLRANPSEQKYFLTQASVYSKEISKAQEQTTAAMAQLVQAAKAKGIDTSKGKDWITELIQHTPDPTQNTHLQNLSGTLAGANKALDSARQQYNATVDRVRTMNPGYASYLKDVSGSGAAPTLTPVGKDTGPKTTMPTDPAWSAAVARGYKPKYKDGKWGLVNPADGVFHLPPSSN